jgi:prepilin-type N-terminal cleavage/methylation domain-containing protein
MRSARRYWLLLVLALSTVAVRGVFTTSRIFFIRDLSFFFWSRHLWLRHTLFSGQAPWWDPYVAAGQSAIADALNQLAMPIALAVRLLPSDIVSFNLWVALPLPIAAAGTFVFLRRHLAGLTGRGDDTGRRPSADGAAALGACAFALSGPIVSMLNLPNLAWSVALVPWVMAAAAEGGAAASRAPRASLLAIAFGLQVLCGEPVTWAATGALVLAFRPRLWTIAGLAGGALLGAAQLVPTLLAGVAAHRSALATPDFWSLHPLSLWETIAPQLFGNYYDAFLADLPWMSALNFGRDPFFYSLYVGPLVLLIGAIGVAERPRRTLFWLAVLIVFTVAALGGYTPAYPLLRRLVPPLMYFRFPTKYIVFAFFAAAVLAAEGWIALTEGLAPKRYGAPTIAGLIGAAGLIVSFYLTFEPAVALAAARTLASVMHLKDPAAGAVFLARVAPPLAVRACALLLAGAVLVSMAPRRPAAVPLLFVAVCADLLITNGGLNMTLELSKLTPPAWFADAGGQSQRMYIGGRVRGYMNSGDPDASSSWRIPAEQTAVEGRMELNALLPMAPSGWRVREALSYDLPYVWPAQYEATVRQFETAGPAERDAFLRRSAVRWCVVSTLQAHHVGDPSWRVIATVDDWTMRAYECHPDASRVIVASAIAVAADPQDGAWQRQALFDPATPDTAVRVDAMPPLAGRPGQPAPTSLRLVKDEGTSVTIEAALPEQGLLVLRDWYDPSWHAQVDGADAAIARVDGIHRGVLLPPGRHEVQFTYRPRDFYAGLTTSVATLIVILLGFNGARARRPQAGRQSGFTLLEMLIVLAILSILLGVAFTEYRGLQAKGNEASALEAVRSISVAQWQFALTCGRTKYATTLEGLTRPVPQTGHAFLSPDLGQPNGFEHSGYRIQMAAKPIDGADPACNGAAVADGYAATADPVQLRVTGDRFYGVNADRVIFYDAEKTFTKDMPESGAPPHGVEVK